RMPHKLLQRHKPALRQIANLPLRHKRRRPRPVRREPGSRALVKRERIDLKAVRKPHGGVAAVPQPHSITRPSPVRIHRRRKPPEIVEADLRRRKAGKLRTRPRVQIPQQPVAKPVARHPSQLLLDQLERPPKRRTAAQSLLNINPAHIQPHRIEAGEPAHRARKIDIPRHLLPPVSLPINPSPSTPPSTAARPPRPRRPHHCAMANASPVSSTCWMPQWNAAGTRVSNACVTAAGSVSVSRPVVPTVSRAGSSAPSTSDSDRSLSI